MKIMAINIYVISHQSMRHYFHQLHKKQKNKFHSVTFNMKEISKI